jgi:hypothetical protein
MRFNRIWRARLLPSLLKQTDLDPQWNNTAALIAAHIQLVFGKEQLRAVNACRRLAVLLILPEDLRTHSEVRLVSIEFFVSI